MDTEQRLARIEAQLERTIVLMETLSRRVEEQVDRSDEWRGRVARTLWGSNGTPGLLVRLDRLEQAQERHRWLQRLVVGAVVALVGSALWGLLGA